ncbi:hypothetical protein TNIN_383261 [Trichonephila inaurata madagascariensis]|uniref:Uncharacterized protein n=1 Tax=Trichonephila inaurata madagascariensis TaxID=2747483 RepID=A0A8X6WY01_9ARAC|nr:hypothetical protein TNIN_383261 [Trichonephila inaurata madagascariensis]
MSTLTFKFHNPTSISQHATTVTKQTRKHDRFTSMMIDTLIPHEHFFRITSRTAIGDHVISILLLVIVICSAIYLGTPVCCHSLFLDALSTSHYSYADAHSAVELAIDVVFSIEKLRAVLV